MLWVQLYLAQDKSEEINGYFDNDMFSIILKIRENGENDYTMEKLNSSYLIKPTSEYMAYGRRQLEDLEQGNIHENHLELVKEKLK